MAVALSIWLINIVNRYSAAFRSVVPRPARPEFSETRQAVTRGIHHRCGLMFLFGSGYRDTSLRHHDSIEHSDDWNLSQVRSHQRPSRLLPTD